MRLLGVPRIQCVDRVCNNTPTHVGVFFVVYLYLEKQEVIFYTAYYEDFEPVFFKAVGCYFCHADVNFNRAVMDDANHVYDEVFVEIRH